MQLRHELLIVASYNFLVLMNARRYVAGNFFFHKCFAYYETYMKTEVIHNQQSYK